MRFFPACPGKITWAIKPAPSKPWKQHSVLGTSAIMDKMRVMGLRLIQQATKCLNCLLQIATCQKCHHVLDQTNVYGSAQRPNNEII